MTLLIPGDTCWRTERAERVAFLIDTEAYFTALDAALHKAERSILILGWGFDPRTRLSPDGLDGPDDPDEVGRVLLRLAAERPDLDIRVLIWKSALPISASQEFFPHKARKWFEGSRVKFRLDDQVPIGAALHPKLVGQLLCGRRPLHGYPRPLRPHLKPGKRNRQRQCPRKRHGIPTRAAKRGSE